MRFALVTLACIALLAGCGRDDDGPVQPGDPVEEIGRDLEEAEERAADLPDVSEEGVRLEQTPAEAIRWFQRLGWFAGADPARLARRLARRHRREWGEPLRLRTIYDELTLTGYDRRRVWFQDTEGDVLEGNDAYVAFLRALARISRGTFAPRGIAEEWAGEYGPVRITFTLHGRSQAIRAAETGDFLDLCLLPQLNRLLDGRRFEVFLPFDQTAYVVALTRAERRMLERERGWRFATAKELRNAFALGQLYEKGTTGRC